MSILADPTPPSRIDARRQARSLYWRGWDVTAIAEELGLKRPTVQAWKDRDAWADAPPIQRMEECLYTRFQTLVDKERKTSGDLAEIDLLCRQMERLARVRRYEAPGGHEGDLNDKVDNRNSAPRKPKAKTGHFTAEQVEQLERLFHDNNFEYQETWWANISRRTRFILKSRQIGASYYFAREALLDALKGGGNQVFLSASKRQARIFRNYIILFALQVGVTLKGQDEIVVTSDLMPPEEPFVKLTFLGTNSLTAQGETGNFYFDECFWVHRFKDLNKVAAKGIASHKRWRRTYISTPSSVAHEAYDFWTGAAWNKGRKKDQKVEIDVTHDALKDGALGADNIWRHMVTLEDAAAQGCDLFDLDEVRAENSVADYANLYGCQFVDDSESAFRFAELAACCVDSEIEWTDVDHEDACPYRGDVWAGYDPQQSAEGDNPALVVAIPPATPGGTFRLIEKHVLQRGLDFEEQADFIAAVLGKYGSCSYLGIDGSNAMGAAVEQLVRPKLPGTRIALLPYDLATKATMVMKAQHTIARQRLAFDLGWVDLVSAFLRVKRGLTESGRSVTFKATRGGSDGGHADLAWATMHILFNEPLDGRGRHQATMEIC